MMMIMMVIVKTTINICIFICCKAPRTIGHFRVPLCLCFKASLSAKNDFYFHEKETARRTHFHMKGFALRLALKQRQKRTRKWPIYWSCAQ